MSEIQVPDEVIVAAYEKAAATYGSGGYVTTKTEDDALGAGVEYAAPIIAAWARAQALAEARAAVDALVVTGGQDVNIDDVQATIDALLAETKEA